MTPPGLPVKNETKSYWIEAAESPLKNHQSSPTLPEETDVVIIGSGYTGASTAYHLYKCTKESGTTPKMLMLEAQDICGSATGRNGGQLRPHAYSRYILWKERFGPKGAIDLINHEMAHLSAFTELLSSASPTGIEEEVCFKLGETFDVAMSEEAWERLKSNYEAMKEDHPDQPVVKQCGLIEDPTEAEKFTQMKDAVGAVIHPAGQIWPYKFVHALLSILLDAKKLALHANTPVTEVSERDAEGWITVKTEGRGSVRTRAVVHATNRWAGHLLPDFENLISPSIATLAAIKPQKGFKLRHTGAEHWDSVVNNYHVQLSEPDNTIIVGGAKKVLVHVPDRWINSTDIGGNIRGVPEYFESWASSSVIGLEEQPNGLARDARDGGCWIGVEGTSADSFPFVGKHPKKEGHFVAAGFTGHGMPRILLSTAHITPMILDFLNIKSSPLFTSEYPALPEPFKLTAERLEKLQTVDLKPKFEASKKSNLESAGKDFCADGGRLARL